MSKSSEPPEAGADDLKMSVLAAAADGDRRALGRLLSIVERADGGSELHEALFRLGSEPDMVVGITGAPGAGKSTLVGCLVDQARSRSARVGVVAVDPSSSLSGGALLGDRIRMQSHANDAAVFTRSLASKARLGGLSAAVPDTIRALVACGYRTVLVETVGVGQSEVAVRSAVDTAVVVVTPGWGDEIQVAKAGLLEVADVFVVNKADRPGASETQRQLRELVEEGTRLLGEDRWRPPVLTCVATTGEGVSEIWQSIERHRAHLLARQSLRSVRASGLVSEAVGTAERRLHDALEAIIANPEHSKVVEAITAGRLDPANGALVLLRALIESPPEQLLNHQ